MSMQDVPPGFIRNLVRDLKGAIPGANVDYLVMCAETLLSGMCFNVTHWNQVGRLNLAIWGMGITRSGEWKTVPIRNYIIPILQVVQSKIPVTGAVVKRVMLPSRFSPEGLIEAMTLHKEIVVNSTTGEQEERLVIRNEGIMICDEFTSLFKGAITKDWMSNVSELLSEVYDTSVLPYYTKKDKLQSVTHCNVAFLSATTPHLYNILSDTFFTQGLGNRIDFVVFDPPEDPPRIDPREFFGIGWVQKKKIMMEVFGEQLSDLIGSNLSYVDLDPKSESASMWARYRYKLEILKRAVIKTDMGSIKWSYLSRCAEKALRRAALYCISRKIKGIPKMQAADTLFVEEEDMRLAIVRQLKFYWYFERLLNRWIRTPAPREAPRTDMAEIERALAIVEDTPLKMISNPQWMKRTGYKNPNVFYNLKGTLIAQGSIVELTDLEMRKLTAEQRESLELTRSTIKVYRFTEQYFLRRSKENPYKF